MLNKIYKYVQLYAPLFVSAVGTALFILFSCCFYYNPNGTFDDPDIKRGFLAGLAAAGAFCCFFIFTAALVNVLKWKSNLYDRLADKEDRDDE